MAAETNQEIQSDEVQALEGIFFDQFVNCNEGCSEWKPLNVILTVVPQRNQSGPLEAHVQLDLHVIATKEYPDVVPKIVLEKPKGLSTKQLANIQNEVDKMCASKIGEVMIFELYHHIQKFLTECNKPSFESFYEEMLSRQKEKRIQEAVIQKNEEDIERRLLQLELDGIKEKRKRNRGNNSSPVADISTDTRRRTISSSSIEEDFKGKNTENVPNSNFNIANIPFLHAESRLVKEFEILDYLGKGAFGDVLKVHAKVDGCLYAVKRIKLNLRNKLSNKKIIREVQLLRSLNHENIVRYYFSWLEDLEPVRKQSQDTASPKTGKNIIGKDMAESDDLNLSFSRPEGDPSFSDDNDEDEEDEEDWIEFRNQEKDDVDGSNVDTLTRESTSLVNECRLQNQYLYILMEYCEKHTLRNAIDNNLYEDENRVWRLLREVVEGLSYIHQQGIIHRDLKPVNIFIDSEDHVKIGDFGLATGNKQNTLKQQLNLRSSNSEDIKSTQCAEDGSHTGQIGTVLYVAPELNTSAFKIRYNQKVDLYSLGIIFFEMCYHPFKTEMERHKTLMNLRSDTILFPNDLYSMKSTCTEKIKLIKALLNHDPMKRPSAADLLEREYIPSAEIANGKILETIRHTLCNPQSKIYKHLISECFNQKVRTAVDITFHDGLSHAKIAWQHAFIEIMADNAREVFRLHGGTFFNVPTLSPYNGISVADGGVLLMTRSGGLVNLPYDVRISFARYLAQNPAVTHLKRYSIDKVFRERRLLESHPREIFECTFDIVSLRSSYLIMEAEALSIVCQYLDRFSESLHKNCVIRLNHVSLVAAIFFHNHIERKRHVALCKILNASKFQVNSALVEKRLTGLDVQAGIITNLINTMNVEIQPNKLRSHFDYVVKKSSSACATECKAAFGQLEMLVEYLNSLDLKCSVVIAPNVVSNFHYYSGLMFQVVWDRKNKNRLEKDIIATGGRYDNLISLFRKTLKIGSETKQSAVGLTIHMEKLINILQSNCRLFSTIDVLVCSVGQNDTTADKFEIMKELWNAGIRCTTLDVEESLEDTQNYCEKMNIAHIVYIKESEPGIARLKSWIKDRYSEKKLSFAEIVPYLKKLRSNGSAADSMAFGHNHHYSRSESRSGSVSHHENCSRKINITFLTDEKTNYNNKRRYESQITNLISKPLQKVSHNIKVEVITLDVEDEVIKALISSIDVDPRNNNDLSALCKRYPKYKKCFSRIGDYIDKLQSGDKMSVFIFFNLRDNYFKVIL